MNKATIFAFKSGKFFGIMVLLNDYRRYIFEGNCNKY